MTALLPCPFCGASDHLVTDFGITCRACHTQVVGSGVDSDAVCWNRRPSPARDEGAGAMGRGEEFLEFKEALSDLRSLRHEYECLNGGGPGWAARNEAAWARVNELFANEDEAAWVRQQEDAHG